MSILFVIQGIFIIIEVLLFLLYIYFIVKVRRAEVLSGIFTSKFLNYLMFGNVIFMILVSIVIFILKNG